MTMLTSTLAAGEEGAVENRAVAAAQRWLRACAIRARERRSSLSRAGEVNKVAAWQEGEGVPARPLGDALSLSGAEMNLWTRQFPRPSRARQSRAR
jgi:hypothetical protein